MFQATSLEIGEVKVGKTKTITFEYEGELEVTSMVAGCHCTKPVHDPEEKKIIVKFKAPEIPKHLTYRGWFITTKKIVVHTPDRDYMLEFRVKIVKK